MESRLKYRHRMLKVATCTVPLKHMPANAYPRRFQVSALPGSEVEVPPKLEYGRSKELKKLGS